MSAFSNDMRQVAVDLCKALGNSATLTEAKAGVYDPAIGETPTTNTDYPLHSAPSSHFAGVFPLDGKNTNLQGFYTTGIIVPWFGHVIDTTWLYNGNSITAVNSISSDNEIIVFNIVVGEKP